MAKSGPHGSTAASQLSALETYKYRQYQFDRALIHCAVPGDAYQVAARMGIALLWIRNVIKELHRILNAVLNKPSTCGQFSQEAWPCTFTQSRVHYWGCSMRRTVSIPFSLATKVLLIVARAKDEEACRSLGRVAGVNMGPLRDYLFKVECGRGDLASILGSDVVRSGAVSKRPPASTHTS